MSWGKLINIGLVCLVVTSCAANVDRTNETRLSAYSESEIKQKLIPEVTRRKDILIDLGVPVNTADYNNTKHWEYYSKIVDRRIFLIIPIINDREQFLSIDFTNKGTMTAYHYTEK